jgi:hypothetical protein
MKRAVLALATALSLFGLMPFAANAAPTCSPTVNAPTQWPPANSVKTCVDGTPPVYPATWGFVRSTIEQLGANNSDAAERLKQIQVTSGETISVNIFDIGIPGGYAGVTHTTVENDSPVTIASSLVKQINDLSLPFYAAQTGKSFVIYAFSGNTTTFIMSTSVGAHETITQGSDVYGNTTATIDGIANSTITWYEFATQGVFSATSPPLNKPAAGTFNSTLGVTSYEEGRSPPDVLVNEKYHAIWERDGNNAFNNRITHTTAHETGHGLDHMYAWLAGFDNSTAHNKGFSDGTDFLAAVARDFEKMRLIPPCNFQATDGRIVYSPGAEDPPVRTGGAYASHGYYDDDNLSTGGLPGFLTDVVDHEGTLICNDREPISKYNNGGDTIDIITGASFPANAAFPNFNSDNFNAREHFANLYARFYGYPDTVANDGNPISGSDRLFQSGYHSAFACSSLYVGILTTYGRLPTSDELAQSGYVVPSVVDDGGPDNGMHGYGEKFHSCDGEISEESNFSFGS